MGRLIKASRPSPAIVIAALALVAAVAGTAFAGPEASTSAINKKKVKKIATKQINKLAPDLSVASAQTANSAESANTANTAATANTALNANAVGNVKVRRVSFRANTGTGPTQILNVGGLRLTASCTGSFAVVARTTANGSSLMSYSDDAAAATSMDNSFSELPFDVGETRNLVFEDPADQVGHTRFDTPGGSTLTLQWMATDRAASPFDCFFTGHAMQSG